MCRGDALFFFEPYSGLPSQIRCVCVCGNKPAWDVAMFALVKREKHYRLQCESNLDLHHDATAISHNHSS